MVDILRISGGHLGDILGISGGYLGNTFGISLGNLANIMGMSLRIYWGYPEWHQSATPEGDIWWWHQRMTQGSDTRESNKRAWHQKVTPDCCLLMLIDANWCWLMLINAHIWFTRFSYVGAYLPSFFDHFLASQELCATFWKLLSSKSTAYCMRSAAGSLDPQLGASDMWPLSHGVTYTCHCL